MTLRALGARLVYRVAVASRVAAWVRRGRNEALILAYHNVVPDGPTAGERALHVPLARFREQMERVTRLFQVVPLTELLERQRMGRSLEGLAAVTFDDGYRGVLQHALPVLAALGCPATLFVVTGALGRDQPFWWDRLAARDNGEVRERERWLNEFGGEEARILTQEPGPVRDAWGREYLAAGAEELAALDHRMFSLGVHTVTHPNLIQVPNHRREWEMQESWLVLRRDFYGAIPVVAYPYGASDARVAAVAAANGLAGVTLGNKCLTHRDNSALAPRVFVGPDTTADALELAALGLRLKGKQ